MNRGDAFATVGDISTTITWALPAPTTPNDDDDDIILIDSNIASTSCPGPSSNNGNIQKEVNGQIENFFGSVDNAECAEGVTILDCSSDDDLFNNAPSATIELAKKQINTTKATKKAAQQSTREKNGPDVLTLSDDSEEPEVVDDVSKIGESRVTKPRKAKCGRFTERLTPEAESECRNEGPLLTAHLKLDELLAKAMVSGGVSSKLLQNSKFLSWIRRLRPTYQPASAERFFVHARPNENEQLRVSNAMGRFAFYIDNRSDAPYVDIYLHNGEQCVFYSRVDSFSRSSSDNWLNGEDDNGGDDNNRDCANPSNVSTSSKKIERLLSMNGFRHSIVQVEPISSEQVNNIVSNSIIEQILDGFEMSNHEDLQNDATPSFYSSGSTTEALLANCLQMGAADNGEMDAWLNGANGSSPNQFVTSDVDANSAEAVTNNPQANIELDLSFKKDMEDIELSKQPNEPSPQCSDNGNEATTEPLDDLNMDVNSEVNSNDNVQTSQVAAVGEANDEADADASAMARCESAANEVFGIVMPDDTNNEKISAMDSELPGNEDDDNSSTCSNKSECEVAILVSHLVDTVAAIIDGIDEKYSKGLCNQIDNENPQAVTKRKRRSLSVAEGSQVHINFIEHIDINPSRNDERRRKRKQSFQEDNDILTDIHNGNLAESQNLRALLIKEITKVGTANISCIVVARPDPVFDNIMEAFEKKFDWIFTSYSLEGIILDVLKKTVENEAVASWLVECYEISATFQQMKAFAQLRETCRRLAYDGRVTIRCPMQFPLAPSPPIFGSKRFLSRLSALLNCISDIRFAIVETLKEEMFIGTKLAETVCSIGFYDKPFWRMLDFFLPVLNGMSGLLTKVYKINNITEFYKRRAVASNVITNVLINLTMPSNSAEKALNNSMIPVTSFREVMEQAQKRMQTMRGINAFLNTIVPLRKEKRLMESHWKLLMDVYSKILNNRDYFSTCDRNGARWHLAAWMEGNSKFWSDELLAFGALGRAYFSVYFVPLVLTDTLS